MFCAASINNRASACASEETVREQPFGHHRSQHYMLYIQVDEDLIALPSTSMVQMLEFQVYEE